MDLLADLFREAGLCRRLLDLRQLAEGSALRFPCSRSMGLHVVRQGTVYLHAASLREPLQLGAGDIALMARGSDHVLGTQPVLRPESVRPIRGVASPEEAVAAARGSTVISGAYQFWNEPVHPFFRELPDWYVLRAAEIPRLGPLALAVGLLDGEAGGEDLGAETLVHGLLDVVFALAMRALVAHRGEDGANWSRAVRDPQVRKALDLMHADCGHAWTLESLAAGAGLSRTGLAERFRTVMGDTPLNHLRAVRMQKAMSLLGETGHTLDQVARAVGYQDAFGFSKVFKRTTGVSPSEFRRRNAQERDVQWRFRAG